MSFLNKLFGKKDVPIQTVESVTRGSRVVGDVDEDAKQKLIRMLAEQQALQDELGGRGVSAEAIVTGFKSIISLNQDGIMASLTAQVLPTEAEPFISTFNAALAIVRLARYQPGQRVWVRFDPNDRSRVALDFEKQHGTISRGNATQT